MLIWDWKPFDRLSLVELYEVMVLRQRVFVTGQNCAYLDADGLDLKAWHLLGIEEGGALCAYLRVLSPGVKYEERSLGRVASDPNMRKMGYGRALMSEALLRVDREFGASAIRISAQAYLEQFYKDFGFKVVSGEYLEDGIAHVEMLRTANLG